MGYTHFDKVSGINGVAVGAKGSEVAIASATGALSQSGTEITASAAELNQLDASSKVVNAADSTLAVTAALHAGRIITMNKAAGVTATLPAATGTGNVYTFIIGTAATSNANIIKVANATDVMNGSTAYGVDDDGEGATGYQWMAEAGDDTITMSGTATGGLAGNKIVCIDYATGFWSCTANLIQSGGSEATPFSATVS